MGRPDKPVREVPIGLEARANEPELPGEFDERELPVQVRAELRGLPKELAHIVAGHLVAASAYLEEDPELAMEHAMAARRRAARLPVIREAAAESAYAAGHYDIALTEYRALRRLTGEEDYLPVIADCERAQGNPEAALRLAKRAVTVKLSPAQRIEMRIVEAGARDDLGQREEALRLLRQTISSRQGPRPSQARLRYAYADLLERSGEPDQAREWFAAAARMDPEGELDADERMDRLDGVIIQVDEDEDDEEELGDEPGPADDDLAEDDE